MRTNKLKLSITLIVLFFSMVLIARRQNNVDILIRILEKSLPETDSLFAGKDPKLDGKLEILRSIYFDNIAYRFQVYKIEDDSLRKGQGYLFTKRFYTHAYYHWASDEIIEVKLVNLETDQKGPVILLSNIGRRSTMDIIEKGDLE